ncbi:MAG TPA: hypothetical protein VLW50_07345 [Streptosporangiaceae bacterium]|nr:hypothetical protein [Streptosporangiaceae bacterium]
MTHYAASRAPGPACQIANSFTCWPGTRQPKGNVLARYEWFAADARSPAARYLVRLIIEDERGHHRILAELALSSIC